MGFNGASWARGVSDASRSVLKRQSAVCRFESVPEYPIRYSVGVASGLPERPGNGRVAVCVAGGHRHAREEQGPGNSQRRSNRSELESQGRAVHACRAARTDRPGKQKRSGYFGCPTSVAGRHRAVRGGRIVHSFRISRMAESFFAKPLRSIARPTKSSTRQTRIA